MIPHKDEYLFKNGTFCPFCKIEQIEGSSVEIDAGTARQEMTCCDCEKKWIDVYRLVDVEEEA